MKKIAYILIVIMIVLPLLSVMAPTVSANNELLKTYEEAADGELLCRLYFGEKTGAYTPSILTEKYDDLASNLKVADIYDDGRTIKFSKPNEENEAFWYGGRIEGLSLGNDKTYTMTMKISLPDQRAGIYFNYPTKETEKQSFTGQLYGIYGKFGPDTGDIGAMQGGGRVAGRYIFNTSGYISTPVIKDSVKGELLDLTFLIEGYTYSVFLNGEFVDWVIPVKALMEGKRDDLGFTMYIYHFSMTDPLIVKDVNVYKGDVISGTVKYPEYAKEYKYYTTSPSGTLPKDEVTTTTPETTLAPETEAPTPDTEPITTDPGKVSDNGCGSFVTSGTAIVTLISLATIVVVKRKRR